MNRVCANCPHPSYCGYRGYCASGVKVELDACAPCIDPSACAASGKCDLVSSHVEVYTPPDFTDAADDVRKATPIDAIFKFWPDAMVALAQHIWKGNEKYNPEHPKIGWIREKSSDHVGSMTRHLCYDYVKATTKEAKVKVMSAIAWRALAELQLLTEEKDDE